MIRNQRVAVVLPAFNAEKTLEQTYREIPFDIVDDLIIVDDASSDGTVQLAKRLGIANIIVHDSNRGYGANQKTCYLAALRLGADIVIMLHPDYQYTPRLLHAMAFLIADGAYPVVLGSRILGNGALKGGMPLYKYMANRVLTLIQNLLIGAKLSEFHTGFRAFSATVLRTVNFEVNSDDFVFDNEMLSQILYAGYDIAEVTCPTKYFADASSINLGTSIRYGLGVLRVSIGHLLQRLSIVHLQLYEQPAGERP